MDRVWFSLVDLGGLAKERHTFAEPGFREARGAAATGTVGGCSLGPTGRRGPDGANGRPGGRRATGRAGAGGFWRRDRIIDSDGGKDGRNCMGRGGGGSTPAVRERTTRAEARLFSGRRMLPPPGGFASRCVFEWVPEQGVAPVHVSFGLAWRRFAWGGPHRRSAVLGRGSLSGGFRFPDTGSGEFGSAWEIPLPSEGGRTGDLGADFVRQPWELDGY